MSNGLLLEDYIKSLRQSLVNAMAEGSDKSVRFRAEEITLELAIGASKKTTDAGGIKFEVFGIGFNAGRDAEKGDTSTQKLTLKLKLAGTKGDDMLISDNVSLD